jgi:hypothetical protein
MACCILGAMILSALFQAIGALARPFGLARPTPAPTGWRLGTAAPAAVRPAPWRPVGAYVGAPIAIVLVMLALFRSDPAIHDLVIRAGLSLGIPLSQFIAWCGV